MQLRQERLEAYIGYWTAYHSYFEVLETMAGTPKESPIDEKLVHQMRNMRNVINSAMERVRLISSSDVFEALESHIDANRDLRRAAFEHNVERFGGGRLSIEGVRLLRAMRAEHQDLRSGS
jgi:hypothetical protein